MGLPELRGRTAVVTGASRGLGAGLARAFAAHGLQLGLCARGPIEAPGAALVESLDVRDLEALRGFAARVGERFGHIDLWVGNAGVLAPIGPLRDVPPAAWRENVEINLIGVFNGARAYLEQLRAHPGPGVLIHVSSGAARRGYAGWSAYCAAKAGVDRLTESLQLEEAASGLRCHAVSPGLVDTDMQAEIRATEPDRFPEVGRFIEAKRSGAFNTPDFVARHLLEIAFDPDRAEPVVCSLPRPDPPTPAGRSA